MINGAEAENGENNQAAMIPNLDSIAQFRIITNNFDAEYGNFSGGQVNVVTKSGTNAFHGDAFDFLRNTDLDAANYFASGVRGKFIQNQFGGTFGGPVTQKQTLLLRRLPGHADDPGRDAVLYRTLAGRSRRQPGRRGKLARNLHGGWRSWLGHGPLQPAGIHRDPRRALLHRGLHQ